MKRQSEEKIILYRGTSLNKHELERLKLMEGKVFATNDYWSTSRNPSIARWFIGDGSNMVPVLYEIECYLRHCGESIIVADVKSFSEFDDAEEEWLFDAGSVFQVEHLTEGAGNEPYRIRIKTTEKGGELAKQFREEYREELKYESPRIMIGILLKRIGQYEKSFRYFQKLLENPGEENLSHIHKRLGIALTHQNKCEEALGHFDKAYQLALESYPVEKIYIALIHHDRGLVLDKQGKFDDAFDEHTQAIKILEETIGDNNRSSADIYTCVERYFFRKKDYPLAKYYQNKVSEIRSSCLPPEHHHRAFSFVEMAKTYLKEKNYKKALEYNIKALELRQKCLLTDHVNIASSLYYTGKAYDANKQHSEALDYYQKALDMTRKCLPLSQQRTAPDILESIAKNFKRTPEQALKYLLEAYDAQQKLEPVNYTGMARTLDAIVTTYKGMGIKDKCNEYHDKALAIRKGRHLSSKSKRRRHVPRRNEKLRST